MKLNKYLLTGAAILVLAACATEEDATTTGQTAPSPIPATSAIKMSRMDMAQESFAFTYGMPMPVAPYQQIENTEQYDNGKPNPIKLVSEEPVSTFSADVDTASYSRARRALNDDYLPPSEAIRIEEMVNYFDYDYQLPTTSDQPFTPTVWTMPTPWNDNSKLLHIGIKGYDVQPEETPDANIVFLLDVSGSMNSPDKLPLLKKSINMMVEELDKDDSVAIVVYAGAAGVVLEPTGGNKKRKISEALNKLSAGGSTAGGQGLELAYKLAQENFDDDKVNRVILATDGDFNVGITDPDRMKDFITEKRDSGIFLTVLGFGDGNYNDVIMQQLAQNGNGTAAYIDTLKEARKVLVREFTSTVFPIAKDLKFQIEFNPAVVAEYRLIGYETRLLNREDFNNDKVDAGDIGSGHTVTALYEITLTGDEGAIDPLRYGEETTQATDKDGEIGFLKMRYKLPNQDESTLITTPVELDDIYRDIDNAPRDARFAAAVAAMGHKMSKSDYLKDFSYDDIIDLAVDTKGRDRFGYRAEFVELVDAAKRISERQASTENG
jgi:Ca-activated chloride channel family protein